MQSTIEEARRRIIEADERGDDASFDDVLVLLREDRIVGQCAEIVVKTIVHHVENHPRPKALEQYDAGALTPDSARNAVLRALDTGEALGPVLGKWMDIDRAAQALFRFTYQTIMAPDTVLHLEPAGLVATA